MAGSKAWRAGGIQKEGRDVMKVNIEGFGKRLKRARELKRLGQEELAELASLSRSAIQSYERGASSPKVGVIHQLAEILDCDESWLVGMETEKEREKTTTVVFCCNCQKPLENGEAFELKVRIELKARKSGRTKTIESTRDVCLGCGLFTQLQMPVWGEEREREVLAEAAHYFGLEKKGERDEQGENNNLDDVGRHVGRSGGGLEPGRVGGGWPGAEPGRDGQEGEDNAGLEPGTTGQAGRGWGEHHRPPGR